MVLSWSCCIPHYTAYPTASSTDACPSGYMLIQRPTCTVSFLFLSVAARKIKRDMCEYHTQIVRTMVRHVICIDEAYVPTVSLEARTLPSQALGYDLRERWGWNRCRIYIDGHEVACSGRNQDMRHVAIYGRIRCVGSVSPCFAEYL